jgi:DNA-binding winged helix-turn-helix (wHTH) protein/pimeloyl-ACP methyl ester carboxylesterase
MIRPRHALVAGVSGGKIVRFSFGAFALDTDHFELLCRGETVAMEPQAFEVLAYLVQHHDRVVSRQELLDAVWATRFVSDSALATRIKESRQAIGDDGQRQELIRTVHRRGYRFIAPVRIEEPASGAGAAALGAATAVIAESPPAAARLEVAQEIRFCTAPDGVRISYATSGSGPPFVKAANWLTNLEFDLESPVWRHLITDLVPSHQVIRYDERGAGLSDWDIEEFSLDAWVSDLETVVDRLEIKRFPLLGISQGGAVAVAYAARHPERVSHLILQGAYARGRNLRGPTGREETEMLIALSQRGWGKTGAFAQVFSARMIPGGSPEQVRWMTDLQRWSTSTENAIRFRRAFSDLDVVDMLPLVHAPTLVLHSRGDQASPFDEGRVLAAGIPNARLVPLETDNHLILEHEPAWAVYRSEVAALLAHGG